MGNNHGRHSPRIPGNTGEADAILISGQSEDELGLRSQNTLALLEIPGP